MPPVSSNSGSIWTPFLERTGGIAPDLPGFGRSDKSAAFDYSIGGDAQFLEAVVDELGPTPGALVGPDRGAVGRALPQERPHPIDRLPIAAPAAPASGH